VSISEQAPTLPLRGPISTESTRAHLLDPIVLRYAEEIRTAIGTLGLGELSITDLYRLIAPPPDLNFGDLAFGCFTLAKALKKAPPQIAAQLAAALETSALGKVTATGPYVNIKLVTSAIGPILQSIFQGGFFEQQKISGAGNTMIEYSQPNTHKELHVGHMRNICLGQALVHTLRYCQVPVISASFPGDMGTHVAKCLWYYKNFNQEPAPKTNKGAWLGSLYTKASLKFEDEAETPAGKENQAAVSQILKELEQQQGHYFDLWKETRSWSIELMQQVYEWANVKFDRVYWESEVDSSSLELVRKYREQGLLKESEGALGVDLSEEKLGFCLLIKSDGNGLYATKDIMLAQRKFEDFKLSKSVYVVDLRQTFHFQQIFASLKHLGFARAADCYHLPYNFVELPDGAMSSRRGNIVPLELLTERMEATIQERYLNQYSGDWSDTEIKDTAYKIAGGAIKFGMNSVDPATKIIFDLEAWLRLDGESGPYVQYTNARIKSVIRKSNVDPSKSQPNWELLAEPLEHELALKLSQFNAIVLSVAETFKTSFLCGYLGEVCRIYNRYYAKVEINSAASPELVLARLGLCQATSMVLEKGLSLLGIAAPARM
jgi:arginyl-tRNA synthetase